MTLRKDQIISAAEEGSDLASESLNLYKRAQDALAKADAKELFVIYEKMVESNDKMCEGMALLVNHYAGDQKTPRYQGSTDAVNAMKEVALAAMKLAESIVSQK